MSLEASEIEVLASRYIAEELSWETHEPVFADLIYLATDSLPDLARQLAREFEVAESTVNRWAKGTSTPLRRVRDQIADFIHDQAKYAQTLDKPLDKPDQDD